MGNSFHPSIYIKNKNGRIVGVNDELARHLLDNGGTKSSYQEYVAQEEYERANLSQEERMVLVRGEQWEEAVQRSVKKHGTRQKKVKEIDLKSHS